MPLPTLDDLKAFLNIPSSDISDDLELSNKLDAARDVVSNITGALWPGSITETRYDVASRLLVLGQTPVSEVSAVTASRYPGSPSVTYDPTAYVLDSAIGALRLVDGSWFRGDVTVTYTAGYTDIPAAMAEAILIIAGHLWDTQRGTSPSALSLQQDIDTSSSPIGLGYAIPSRARELLAGYISPSVA